MEEKLKVSGTAEVTNPASVDERIDALNLRCDAQAETLGQLWGHSKLLAEQIRTHEAALQKAHEAVAKMASCFAALMEKLGIQELPKPPAPRPS